MTEARMTRAVVVASAMLALGVAVHTADAQTFKVAKYNIKGEGGTDYVTAEAGTGRVFVSRATHVMVVDAAPARGLATFRIHRASTVSGSLRKPVTGLRQMAAIRRSPCLT